MKLSMHHLVCLAVLFFVVANPMTYDLVNRVVPVTDGMGCPSQMGVAVHAVVFALAVSLCCRMKMM